MCRVFQQGRRVATVLSPGLDPSDAIIYVFVVANVVTKMVLCARTGPVRLLRYELHNTVQVVTLSDVEFET